MRGAARRIALLLLLLPMRSFAAAPDTALPRLSGVVVGPGGASAIFSDDHAGRLFVLAPGETIGGYVIRAITPGEVVLDGPEGRQVLTPVERAGPRAEPPPPPSPAEQGAVATGATVGGLAVRYDGCVQRGLLPDSGAAGGAQLAAMLDAMARVPPHPGRQAGAAGSPAQLAAWMRQGWEAAAREAERHPDDAASCAALAADWRRVARTYGFQ
jgi:hypothetical protein